MKRLVLSMAFLLTVLLAKGQETGIRFLKNTKWREALAQAKAQNKLLFVDVYTDWCGPCKTMDVEVFPQKAVGDKYNTTFINYKLDAEKGEGPELKQLYQVKSYPNYLFVNGDGVLIYRSISAMPANELLVVANNALAEARQEQTIIQLDALYPTKKKDKAFMQTYLQRKTALRLSNPDLVDEYIQLLSPSERREIGNLQLILDNGTFLNRNLQLGIALTTLTQNQDLFSQLRNNPFENLASITSSARENTLRKAIQHKDDSLLKRVLAISPKFAKNWSENTQTVNLAYYLGTKQYQQYLNEAKNYAHNLLAIPIDSLNKWDIEIYRSNKARMAKTISDTSVLNDKVSQYKHANTIKVLKLLDDLVKNMTQVSQEPTDLKTAKTYSDYTLAITKTDFDYYKNVWPIFVQNNSILTYKLGNRPLAIANMEQMIATINHPKATEYFAPLLNRMKANEKL